MDAGGDRVRRTGRAALLVLCAVCLAACANSPVRTLEDGILQVDCDGGYHDWSACYAAAQRHCGDRTYEIVAQISDEGGAVGSGDWSREGSVVSRSMEFRCVD